MNLRRSISVRYHAILSRQLYSNGVTVLYRMAIHVGRHGSPGLNIIRVLSVDEEQLRQAIGPSEIRPPTAA
jgi:hypothetical protein